MNNTKNLNCPETQQRIADNIDALKAFKAGDASLIEKYSGWGGLRDAIFNRDIFCQLKFDCGLSDAEIASIKQTTSNGYFTPVEIVRQMWQMCERYMPEPPKRILDPACGTGHFFANMPEAWRTFSQLVGVELDSVSAEMAATRVAGVQYSAKSPNLPAVRLPGVEVQCVGFEEYRTPEPFSLCIGNPPYGKITINDPRQPDLMQYCIHHAFALKGFRLLAEGGYLCLLLPSWFMDNGSKHVREVMAAEGAALVEAVRLPDSLFKNAKVTVDCVLIKKCAAGQNSKAWAELGRVQVDGRSERINRYFLDNPKQVLGKLASVPMYERYGLTCQWTQDPIVLWQALGGVSQVASVAPVVDVLPNARAVGLGKLDTLIAQCEAKIKALQRQYRELTGLKLQQQTMEAQINALQL